MQKTSRKSGGASKCKVKSELTLIKEKTRNSWFDPDKYDTSCMKHPKNVKKELPDNAEIFCIKCNEVFSNPDEQVSHKKQCFKGRRYPCEFQGGCECTFLQKSLMHQHLKAVHFDDPFKCEFCTQTFVYKKSLDAHLNKLQDQKDKQDFKYRCSQCEKVTDDLTEFQTHMNRHQNIKPYRCNICNEKSFYSQSQLTEHLRKCRQTEVKYECAVCGKKFAQEDRYCEHFKVQHVDTVQGEIYYCEICIIHMFTEKAFQKHLKFGDCSKLVCTELRVQI